MPNKQIPPSPKLIEYLNETLRLEKMKLKKLDKRRSLYDQVDPTVIRNNDEKKVRWLDNLFESIANLIYFFEYVNGHPELMGKFKDDIEDMMGETIKSQLHLDSKKAPFARLIRELIGLEYTDENFSYRTRLLHMLQFLINRKSDQIMMKLEKVPTLNDWQMRAMMSSDMKRAQTWIGYLDKYVADKETEPNRILGF
jgi:hypothetical protein